MEIVRINELPLEVRKEISEIYAENVAKIRQTTAIAKRMYASEFANGDVTCRICGNPIEKGLGLHADIHALTSNKVYWSKENLIWVHRNCHDNDEYESFMLASGKIIRFAKQGYERPYRDYLKDPELV